MNACRSLSRIIVLLPTFVRRSFPFDNQAWTVHLLMPPKRSAACSTLINLCMGIASYPNSTQSIALQTVLA
jgi:hypothetical protein